MTRKEWKKLDNLIKTYSKEDKNYTCEVCGRRKEDGWQIHHHHFIGRTKTALRWINENIFVVCASCHSHFEEDPQWAVKTGKDMRGAKWYNLLTRIKDRINRKTFDENLALMDKSLDDVLKSYNL